MFKKYAYMLMLVAGVTLASCKDDDDDNTPSDVVNLTATLNGANHNPAVATSATGTFTGSVNKSTKVLTYSVAYAGLTPVNAHIHRGGPGHNGGVIVPFAPPAAGYTSPIAGTFTFTQQADVDSLLAGRMYVNLHTAANPGGEIRGNIAKQ